MKINKIAVIVAIVGILGMGSVAVPKASTKTITLTSENTLVLNGEVNDETVSELILKIRELTDSTMLGRLGMNNDPIYLVLYTPGGDVQKGLELVEALKGTGRRIHTITMFAASMGFQIAQAMDNRYILKNGVLMSHQAYGGSEGSFGGSKPDQLSNRLRIWYKRIEEMDEQTVKRTKGKQTMESYTKAYQTELWLTGSQSIDGGYADSIVQVKCDSSLSGVSTKKLLFMGLIPVAYDLDNCPLNTSPMNVRIEIETNKGRKESNTFLAEGGGFGVSCLQDSGLNKDRLCATDTSLSIDKVNDVKRKFSDRFINIKDYVIRMRP